MRAIVVGAGISGLLSAQALLDTRTVSHLTLIGPREPPQAHLLSYWSSAPTPFDPWAIATWRAISVAFAGEERELLLQRYAYRTFRAGPWAAVLRGRLEADQRVDFVEARAEAIEDDLTQPRVFAGRQLFRADWVLASSPPKAMAPVAWQRFEGWELELERGALDTRAVTLLDFRTPQEADFRFVYALPFAPDRLFVEHVSYQSCDHGAALERWLKERGLRHYRLVDREGGATPIFSHRHADASSRVLRIGIANGAAKPCTGYALIRIWREALAIAQALGRGHDPHALLQKPSFQKIADRFFLDLLGSDPGRLRVFLSGLFSSDGDAVLAFLDEQATIKEQLEVARAAPGWLGWALGLEGETLSAASPGESADPVPASPPARA